MLRKYFSNMKIGIKISIAFVALAIPLAINFYSYSAALMDDIVFAKKEVEGAHVVLSLAVLLDNSAEHRSRSLVFSNTRNPSEAANLRKLEGKINQDFKDLRKVLENNPYIGVEKQVTDIETYWKAIEKHAMTASVEENLKEHNDYINKILSLIITVADISNLTFDPLPDTYYFMAANTLDIPKIINNIGLLRGLGSTILLDKSKTPKQHLELGVLKRLIEDSIDNLKGGENAIFDFNPSLESKFTPLYNEAFEDTYEALKNAYDHVIEVETLDYPEERYFEEMTVALQSVLTLDEKVNHALIELLEARVAGLEAKFYFDIAFVAIFGFIALFTTFFVVRGIKVRMEVAQIISRNIARGNLSNDFPEETKDEAGLMLTSLAEMQELLHEQQGEIAKLASTIENVPTSIMMSDVDFNITYMNPAVMRLLRAREAQLRQKVADFDVDKLIGTNIDRFHKNPAHQRALLSDDARLPWVAEINVAGVDFRLTAVSLKDPVGQRIGNTVIWDDITEELDAQKQIGNIISGAVEGKLNNRLETTEYNGVMKTIGDGVNQLLDTVVEPIKQSTSVMQSLAKGNLTEEMTAEYSGDFRELAEAVNFSVANLRNLVGEIIESASHVSSSAKEISQGNIDLSQRTEEQASSLEQTAASMEEFTGTVTENATNAERANTLANSAQVLAEKGGEVVNTAVDAMQEIETSSKKISDIISVIDEIAFQTNLLALNASVEAARAGEQGRGFAVVASEVRNLAQRSANAAKEIKELIVESVSNVDQGKRLVDESGSTLKEIVASVGNVTNIIKDIDNASSEQSSGIQQVNQAISQMDEMTQQNAALVEEAAASAESLEEQSASLLEMMKFFNTGTGENTSRQTFSPSGAKQSAGSKRRDAVESPVDDSDDWTEF